MFMLKSPLEISSVAFAEHRVPVFLLGAKGTEPPKTPRSEIPRHLWCYRKFGVVVSHE